MFGSTSAHGINAPAGNVLTLDGRRDRAAHSQLRASWCARCSGARPGGANHRWLEADDATVIATAAQFWALIHGFVMLELAGFYGDDGAAVAPVLDSMTSKLLCRPGRFTRAGETVAARRRRTLSRRKSSRHARACGGFRVCWRDLLDGDGGAGGLELGLGLVGGLLGDLLQQRLGGAVDQVLGLLEAQAGDDLADNLDDADLLVTGGLEDDVELGLLLGGLGGAPRRGRRPRRRPRPGRPR